MELLLTLQISEAVKAMVDDLLRGKGRIVSAFYKGTADAGLMALRHGPVSGLRQNHERRAARSPLLRLRPH